MLRLLGPTLLTLSLAIPRASLALGLGDIRVDSALHQPFVAQIELVGVTHDELGRLSAEIAGEDVFERYGLERAPFVYGTTLVVGQDTQGRPVLNLRSTERFTEPVVTLLVDLHTPNGELIREYTIFLDPPDRASRPSGLESTSAVSTTTPVPMSAPGGVAPGTTVARTIAAGTLATLSTAERASADPDTKPLGHTYTVARRDTLDHIVSITGAHSRTDRHRMMIAIFRANPAAFQNNFNRLHTGATLHFPSSEQLSAISAEEANREYDAQMAAWRNHRVAPAAPATAPGSPANPGAAAAAPVTVASNSPAADSTAAISGAPNSGGESTPADTDSQETDRAVLTQRVASLEKSLYQLRQELNQPLVVPKTVPVAAAAAPALQATSSEDEIDDEDEPPPYHGLRIASIAAGIALSLVAGAWFYRRRRAAPGNQAAPQAQRAAAGVESVPAAETAAPPLKTILGTALPGEIAPREPQKVASKAGNESTWFEDSFSTPIADLLANDPMMSPSMTGPGMTGSVSPATVNSSGPTVSAAHEQTVELPVEATVKLPAVTPVTDGDTTLTLAAASEVVGDTVEQKFSFFNPESANNTEHVVMGSGLEAPKPFVERRKNPVDVLRQAIEREPERSDLRLKLLELYYTAAAENRRAFLDVTRQLAKNEKLASPENWSRIADMGRTIAPDDELFCEELDDKRVA